MSTIDAAIIKALVEHVGGDSSSIPDGTIGGGKTYTEGDGINIVNDQISVEYDANTMELKEGKLAAKTQITVGDGLTTTNGKIVANLDTNTMYMSAGKIGAKTQLVPGDGISISSGVISVDRTANLTVNSLGAAADVSANNMHVAKNLSVTGFLQTKTLNHYDGESTIIVDADLDIGAHKISARGISDLAYFVEELERRLSLLEQRL